MNLQSQVQSTIQKYKMVSPGERILIACSGGADSAALLFLLKSLAPSLGIRLAILHYDHGLRPSSARDFQFVKQLAKKLRLPFYGGRRKKLRQSPGKNISPEEAARAFRYEFFGGISKKTGIRKIALAHHRDDQAETVLMRVIQGTGLRGLQGMRPVIAQEEFILIRPLIEAGRSEIRKFLKENSISFREDRTNQSPRFLRNRIRRHLIPLMEREFNPRVGESLVRLAETAFYESEGLDAWVKKNWRRFVRSKRNSTLRLDRSAFLALPGLLQFRVLDQILRLADRRSGLDFKSWQGIAGGLAKGRYRVSLPRNLDLCLTPKTFLIRTEAAQD